MNIDFTPDSWAQYTRWLIEDRKTLARINELIKDIMCNPYAGKGKPEPLRGDFSGFWSRRIDQKHRLVYSFDQERLLIVQCRGHYTNR